MTTTSATQLLQFDWSGTQIGELGLAPEAIQNFSERLVEIRNQFLEDLAKCESSIPLASDKRPSDVGFFGLPERLLKDYESDRRASELNQILVAARRLRDTVDRVLILGMDSSCVGARALMDSCCHPFHNELSRGERGGAPRVYFEGNMADNDSIAGLLDVVGRGRHATSVDDAWGIVLNSHSGGTLETGAAFRIFLAALQESCRGCPQQTVAKIISVTGSDSKLYGLSAALGIRDVFPVPESVGGRFSVFTAAGLVPAAILGIDIVALLRGAVRMNDHFRAAPPGNNRVLDYAAVCHLMERQQQHDATIRVTSVWTKSLESLGLWYSQLLAESLETYKRKCTSLAVLNTRDLHSTIPTHPEGTGIMLFNNLMVNEWRQDSINVGQSQHDQDGLNRIANHTLPEILSAAIDRTNASHRDRGQPTTDIRLPRVDEHHVGQLLQMLMIATTLERLIAGTNPFGQPGVAGYKQYMEEALGLNQDRLAR